MKFEIRMCRAAALVVAFGLAALPAANASDKKDKNKPVPLQSVDSGSFGIFIKGQRVATETFKIEQQGGASTVKSQLKATAGPESASQKSELDMTASGELIRYEWSQASGASLTVFPNNDFLMERMNAGGNGKPAEQPFLMPSTTAILDNNFFVHREVLAWRYLGAACKPEGGNLKCQQGADAIRRAGAAGPNFNERAHGAGWKRESHDSRRRARTAAPEPERGRFSVGTLGGRPRPVQAHTGDDSCR